MTTQSAASTGSAHPTDYDALIARLDLPTKVTLLTGASSFTLAPEPSIGLGELRLSDGPTGVRGLKFSGGRTVALFPNATLLASAWDEDTAYEVGQLLAEEAMIQQIHVVLGPTINLHRSVLGGRLFEAYSEDPLLTGKLAAAYVRGLQDSGVGACLKHLVANESETERNTVNSVVDEATLRELYLLPFEIAVAEADAWSVMAAYNDVNGVPATEQHHVNNEVLKGEWGYTGLVMSDWFATKSAGPAANGGLDLVMPGPNGPWGENLVRAVESGEVPEAVVDDHLRRLLRLADRVGALGTPRDYPSGLPGPTSDVRREQLTRLAAAGMTVLINAGQALPLRRDSRVALIGRHAVETIGMGGGSAQVNAPYQVSAADGLRALLGDDRVTVTDGVEVRTRPAAARATAVSDPDGAGRGVQIAILDGDGAVLEERRSAVPTTAVGFDDDFAGTPRVVRFRARVDLDGAVEVGAIGAGSWTVRIGDRTERFDLVVAGTGFGEQLLAPPYQTVVLDLAGSEVLEAEVVLHGGGDDDDPLAGAGLFSLVARPAPRPVDDVVADAVRAAADADVAVVVVGLTEEQETESVDKSTIRLPGAQDRLVSAVASVAQRTVVVVNAATPVLLPWRDEVDAIVWAGLPGQEAGHAIAAALLGDIEPAGRLVTTFPAEEAAAPAWSVTPVDGRLQYTEGAFIGYRGHHAGTAASPAFWLGHGLGYTTWEYADATLAEVDGAPAVRVAVTNTGSRPSREVVQVYFQPDEAGQPVRLVGWHAVQVEPGQRSTVEVAADRRLWRAWDTERGAWRTLPDAGTLIVARGLGDVRATLPLGAG